MKKLLLIFPLCCTGCATTQLPGPAGTGAHKTGYDLGRSDAVKQQYWIVQNLQKAPPSPPPRVTGLPITIPAQTGHGVTTVPYTETLCIER